MPAATLVVLNPVSRGGARRAAWGALEARLREAHGPLEVERTRAPGDAARIAREAVRAGVERLLVAGGDGTLCEVVSGLLGAGLGGEVQIGLLPFGSGGDFARALRVPVDPLEAADALLTGKPRPVDAGRIRFRDAEARERTVWFANEASCGASGRVVALAKAGPRWLGGRAAFLLATVRTLLVHRSAPVSVRVDGETVFDGPLALAVASNGGWFGGGMHVAPEARFDDGLLDVVVVGGVSRLRLLAKLRKLYDGSHVSDPVARFFRGRRIELDAAPGTVPFEVDGEALGWLPVRIDVLPSALTLLAPGA